MNDAKLVQAVRAYQKHKDEIKSRQKDELKNELAPWAADIGDEIIRVRNDKNASINDIAGIIGIQNRTFIYDMIAAARARQFAPSVSPTTPAEAAQVTTFSVDKAPENDADREWAIEFFDGVAKVSIEDETYELVIVDGEPDVPDEWNEHTRERRLLYKTILSEIRKHG